MTTRRTRRRRKPNAALHAQFVDTVHALKVRYKGDHNAAADDLYPLFDRGVVSNMFRKLDTHNFDETQKERLLWYVGHGAERFAYQTIAGLMEQRPTRQVEAEDLVGEYTYFRFYSASTNPTDQKFIRGNIHFFVDAGIPRFTHTSHNHKQPDPEHKGYLFHARNSLFLLGMRAGVLRLAITSSVDGSPGSYMAGLVLSVRTAQPHDPFAARFVMMRNSETDLISQLNDGRENKDRERLGKTLGEVKFFEMTGGTYAWLLLAMHG